ncbi:MAG TPA: hypothetical protein VKS82_14605 [Streptosporangiaceae bacterium]|nr:hypothetical protein [Streptosporangiaceae bacterium]
MRRPTGRWLPGTAGRVLGTNDYALAGQEQHVFFATPPEGLQQTFWNASGWHNQTLPGPAVDP